MKVTHLNQGSPTFSTDVNFTRKHPEKGQEKAFSEVDFFFFSFLQRLYFVTENGWEKKQNKTKIQFLK